jgi:DNA-binding MarR family transcriptional regulator
VTADGDLSDADFARLLSFRDALRRFQHWSEQQAAAADLTPAQHQLLLVVRALGGPSGTSGTSGPTGTSGPSGPTIGDVAEHLLLRHHSAVGLADRCVAAGLVRRVPDAGDHRVVRLRLTRSGAARLRRLAAPHLEELRRLAPVIADLDPP